MIMRKVLLSLLFASLTSTQCKIWDMPSKESVINFSKAAAFFGASQGIRYGISSLLGQVIKDKDAQEVTTAATSLLATYGLTHWLKASNYIQGICQGGILGYTVAYWKESRLVLHSREQCSGMKCSSSPNN